MLKTCPTCSTQFDGSAKHCSYQCWFKSTDIPPRACLGCGEMFTPTKKHPAVRSCSPACGAIARRLPRLTAFVRDGIGYLPLPRSRHAKVDASDFERCSAHAWCENSKGVVMTNVPKPGGGQTMVRLNRFIMQPRDHELVDHAHGDQLDNRRSMLRVVDHQQNCFNRRKMNPKVTSRYKGVCMPSVAKATVKPWRAQIRIEGRVVYLGMFTTEDEASRAYDSAARAHFGEFACVNHPMGAERSALGQVVM